MTWCWVRSGGWLSQALGFGACGRATLAPQTRLNDVKGIGQMKQGSNNGRRLINRWRLAGIVAVAAVTAACTASPPAASAPAASSPAASSPAADIACTTVPTASVPAVGTDLPSVPGELSAVAARSPDSAVAVGNTGKSSRSRPLVALWNGAVWKTLNNRGLPPSSELNGVALFPGGAWAVGKYGNIEHKGEGKAFILRVTGTTVRKVPIPRMVYGTVLNDVAATSATDAWAVGTPTLHWNGTAWTRPQLPAGVARILDDAYGVAATSRRNVWIVSLGWIVHWNGRRWKAVTPNIGLRYALSGISATSATNVWAVGNVIHKGVQGVMLHWNGRRWTCALARERHFENLAAISTSSPDNAWAVGSYFDSADRAWVLHWNGHSWNHVMTPQLGQFGDLRAVAVIRQSGRALVVGSSGMLMLNGS
jgi:hypothetical protein